MLQPENESPGARPCATGANSSFESGQTTHEISTDALTDSSVKIGYCYQRLYREAPDDPLTRFVGCFDAAFLERLSDAVGFGDAGFAISAEYGERESFAIVRLVDWLTIYEGDEFGRTPSQRRRGDELLRARRMKIQGGFL